MFNWLPGWSLSKKLHTITRRVLLTRNSPVYDRDALGDHEVVLGHAANVQELDLPWSKRRGDHDTFIARFVHLSICMMRLQSVKRVSVMYPCTFGWWSNPRDVPRVYEKFIDVWFGSSANTARSVRYNGCFANRVLEAKDGTHWARLACPRNEAGGN
jgi:hypothetical protein